MNIENIGEVKKILDKIEDVKNEIEILESKKVLFLKKYVAVFSREIWVSKEIYLLSEDVQALIDLRKKKLVELEKGFEEL